MTDILKTRTSSYHLRPDGIIVQAIFKGDTHSLADARENIAAFNQLAAGQRRPCLVDMAVPYSTDRGVREYYASSEGGKWCSALGLLVKSSLTRVIGNLFLAVNASPLPVRMFTTEAEAVVWLVKFEGAKRA